MSQRKEKTRTEATEGQRTDEVSRSAAIAKSSDEAFIGTDQNGKITAWNPAAETIYGYSSNEVSGRPISILAVPENKAETDRIANGVETGEAFRLETQHLTKNGKRIDVSISVEPMTKDGGDIIGAALIARDVTEQTNKNKVLKKTFLDARNVIEASLDSWVAIGPDGKIIDVNSAAEQLTEVDREHLIGSDFSWHFTEPDKAKEIYRLVFKHGFLKDYPLTARGKSGKVTKLLYNASVFADEAGVVQGAFAAARDITSIEQELSQSEKQYRQIVTTAEEGIWTLDAQNNTTFANDAMAKILGYPESEMHGKSILDCLDKQSFEVFKASVEKSRQGAAGTRELKFKRQDGGEVWTSFNSGPLFGTEGTYEGSLAMVTDITDRREQDERIKFMAFHDIVTGLPNRVLFGQRISKEIDRADANKSVIGFLYLDIDNFKSVKNTIGHADAEKLLKLIVEKIQNLLHKEDLMARLGEDEFLVALLHMNKKQNEKDTAVALAKSMIALFSRPCRIAGRDLNIIVNIGLAFYPKDGRDEKTLQESADAAMLRAKKELGPNSYNIYQKGAKGLQEVASARLDIESRLSNALKHEEFELHYQPVFCAITKRLAYAEALIRWNSSSGLISPSEFIPVAEDTGQICGITEWVLAKTSRKLSEWLCKGFEPVKITVNLSAKGFQMPSLVPTLLQSIEKSGVDPKYLGFEITESALMVDPSRSIEIMNKLKKFGLSLHLDDFGTGYSSLAYFKTFPVDETKIDMSFVNDLATDPASEAIVKAIIILSQGLGLKVTAEGVETHEQFEILKALGCDNIQGFFFSKPLPADKFEKLLSKKAKAA